MIPSHSQQVRNIFSYSVSLYTSGPQPSKEQQTDCPTIIFRIRELFQRSMVLLVEVIDVGIRTTLLDILGAGL